MNSSYNYLMGEEGGGANTFEIVDTTDAKFRWRNFVRHTLIYEKWFTKNQLRRAKTRRSSRIRIFKSRRTWYTYSLAHVYVYVI